MVVLFLPKKREKSYNKQKKPPFYVFGTSYFSYKSILKQLSCFPVPSNAVEIDELYSFDVDTSEDLKKANNFIDKLV